MRNPYTVLGVDTAARPDAIKTAYRRLAKTWHPDQNQDNPQAGIRFAEIAHSYKLLIDPELRRKFDNGDIDARGRRKSRPARGFTANPFKAFKQAMAAGAGADMDGETSAAPNPASFEDMVTHIFGEAAAKRAHDSPAQSREQAAPRSSADAPGMDQDPLDALDELFAKWKTRQSSTPDLPVVRHNLEISLEATLTGHKGEISFGKAGTVGFEVAPGTDDGAEIRVASPDPWTHGDVIITVRRQPHPRFRCSGPDLHGDHAINLAEAVLGGSFVYQGLDGPLRIEIPPWSGSDTVLRIAEKGLPTGHGGRGALNVHLRVMLPETPDKRLIDLMRSNGKAWYL